MFKIVPDQNGDARPDRVVSGRRPYIKYHNPDGRYSKEDPLIHGKSVFYKGKTYKAFQLTADKYVAGKNAKDSPICLVGAKKNKKACSKKGALKVKRAEVRPAKPSLFVYSTSQCTACWVILESFSYWKKIDYCKIELEKVDASKTNMNSIEEFNKKTGKLPLVTFLNTDGSWRKLRQQRKQDSPSKYAEYLAQQISACRKD